MREGPRRDCAHQISELELGAVSPLSLDGSDETIRAKLLVGGLLQETQPRYAREVASTNEAGIVDLEARRQGVIDDKPCSAAPIETPMALCSLSTGTTRPLENGNFVTYSTISVCGVIG